MFPTYTDGPVQFDEYAFEDPLNLNGISDADVAAFMASPVNSSVALPPPSTAGGVGYTYLNQPVAPNSGSPQSYARPLIPGAVGRMSPGVKRKAVEEPGFQTRRKDSRSRADAVVPSSTSDKPNTRLRTSTRTSKRTNSSSSATPSSTASVKPHPRTPHHFTEKKYRDRLNDQFGRLLTALESSTSREFADMGSEEDGGTAGRFLSKSAVLEMARHRLRALEKENEGLAREVERLAEILRARHTV